jgi:hypothetical protein
MYGVRKVLPQIEHGQVKHRGAPFGTRRKLSPRFAAYICSSIGSLLLLISVALRMRGRGESFGVRGIGSTLR